MTLKIQATYNNATYTFYSYTNQSGDRYNINDGVATVSGDGVWSMSDAVAHRHVEDPFSFG